MIKKESHSARKDRLAFELADKLGITIDKKWKQKIKHEINRRGYYWYPGLGEWKKRDAS